MWRSEKKVNPHLPPPPTAVNQSTATQGALGGQCPSFGKSFIEFGHLALIFAYDNPIRRSMIGRISAGSALPEANRSNRPASAIPKGDEIIKPASFFSCFFFWVSFREGIIFWSPDFASGKAQFYIQLLPFPWKVLVISDQALPVCKDLVHHHCN